MHSHSFGLFAAPASFSGDRPCPRAQAISFAASNAALNGIDPVDVNKSYRYEQGFTFELNLAGVADELRDGFAGTQKSRQARPTEDK